MSGWDENLSNTWNYSVHSKTKTLPVNASPSTWVIAPGRKFWSGHKNKVFYTRSTMDVPNLLLPLCTENKVPHTLNRTRCHGNKTNSLDWSLVLPKHRDPVMCLQSDPCYSTVASLSFLRLQHGQENWIYKCNKPLNWTINWQMEFLILYVWPQSNKSKDSCPAFCIATNGNGYKLNLKHNCNFIGAYYCIKDSFLTK